LALQCVRVRLLTAIRPEHPLQEPAGFGHGHASFREGFDDEQDLLIARLVTGSASCRGRRREFGRERYKVSRERLAELLRVANCRVDASFAELLPETTLASREVASDEAALQQAEELKLPAYALARLSP
jgi:hypothetical protein